MSLSAVLPVLQGSESEHFLVCSISDGTEPEGSHRMRRYTSWKGWLLQHRHPPLERTRGLQEPGGRLQSRCGANLTIHAILYGQLMPP